MTDSHLPGLEPPTPPAESTEPTRMELAAAKLLEQLRADGLLKAEHVLAEALILELCRAIGGSGAKGRASAVALASRELREALALLPKTGADAYKELVDDVNDDEVHP
jgi:hypothetical protein